MFYFNTRRRCGRRVPTKVSWIEFLSCFVKELIKISFLLFSLLYHFQKKGKSKYDRVRFRSFDFICLGPLNSIFQQDWERFRRFRATQCSSHYHQPNFAFGIWCNTTWMQLNFVIFFVLLNTIVPLRKIAWYRLIRLAREPHPFSFTWSDMTMKFANENAWFPLIQIFWLHLSWTIE